MLFCFSGCGSNKRIQVCFYSWKGHLGDEVNLSHQYLLHYLYAQYYSSDKSKNHYILLYCEHLILESLDLPEWPGRDLPDKLLYILHYHTYTVNNKQKTIMLE